MKALRLTLLIYAALLALAALFSLHADFYAHPIKNLFSIFIMSMAALGILLGKRRLLYPLLVTYGVDLAFALFKVNNMPSAISVAVAMSLPLLLTIAVFISFSDKIQLEDPSTKET